MLGLVGTTPLNYLLYTHDLIHLVDIYYDIAGREFFSTDSQDSATNARENIEEKISQLTSSSR